MKLTPDQIDNMMKVLGLTRDEELNCNQCLDLVGEFAEHQLEGLPVPQAMKKVEHHLSLCKECEEEYESLLRALKGVDGSP